MGEVPYTLYYVPSLLLRVALGWQWATVAEWEPAHPTEAGEGAGPSAGSLARLAVIKAQSALINVFLK